VNNKLPFISENILDFTFIPENLSIKCSDFVLANYNKALFSELEISLPQSIRNSVAKRQAEFLAGRYTATLALKALGISCNNIAIGKQRSPVWPNKTIASITHTNTTSICVASLNTEHQYLGVDLENIISEKTINEIHNSIIFTNELTVLKNSSLSFEQAFTLTFSAKESLFKALYPTVGYYFDFSAAKITDISTQKSCFTLVLTEDLTDELTTGMVFTGYFGNVHQQIFTLIAQKNFNLELN